MKDMGVSKTEHFSAIQNELATIAKALGHPARIAILDYLHRAESCICSDIVDELPLAQPTISQHLKELKNTGLIRGNVEGTAICYCIDPKAAATLAEFLRHIGTPKTDGQNCC